MRGAARQRAKHPKIRMGVLILQQQALQLKSIELVDQLKATNNLYIFYRNNLSKQ